MSFLARFRRTDEAAFAAGVEPIVVGLERDVVIKGDARAFASWLYENVMADRSSLLRNRERVDFA